MGLSPSWRIRLSPPPLGHTVTSTSKSSWCFERGRILVAAAGTLVAEVLWDKRRDDADGERRFVVLAAGMNDLLRPALYGARHRIVPLEPRAGEATPADVVGPVCESSDRFVAGVPLMLASTPATGLVERSVELL